MTDETITCVGCGRRFLWSVGEQRFYRKRGLAIPRRCPECRADARRTVATAPSPVARAQPGSPLRRAPRRTFVSPLRRYGALLAMSTLALAAGGILVFPPLLAWLVAINLVAFLTYGYDKMIAGTGRMRVPEAVLLGLAAVGGAAGALLGMLLFQHKTSKVSFLASYWGIVAAQVALGVIWLLLRDRL